MKRFLLVLPVLTGLSVAAMFSSSQTPGPEPLTMPLQCAGGDCPLLHGAPQTAAMRCGYVRLRPGETVGWHTTGKNEESLVILGGHGEARFEGKQSREFQAPALVYVPPDLKHNVANTGDAMLEYVYVVAPAQAVPK